MAGWRGKKSLFPKIDYTSADRRYEIAYTNNGKECKSSILAVSPDAATDRLHRHLGHEIVITQITEQVKE